MEKIRGKKSIIDTQTAVGYESSSNFRDALTKILDVTPSNSTNKNILKALLIDTKLGSMLAIADEKFLYLLEFVDQRSIARGIKRVHLKAESIIIPGTTPAIASIKNELKAYFAGKLTEFKTPLFHLGTDFQKRVWQELKKIPIGKTKSYLDIARQINHPTAFRAVALANGANPLAIIVPCHRVINTNGKLGGYDGGLTRKEWLLSHEESMNSC